MSKQADVYCAILAGGSGTRFNSPLPKQYVMLGDAPIFIHAVRTLLGDGRIKQIWIGSNGDWLELAREQAEKYIGKNDRVRFCEGGADRETTMSNTLNAICQNNEISDNDIVLIHDAVRPFLTERIINDVINEMEFCDACNTVVPLNDTISRAVDGVVVDIPNRAELFAGQSPQGFKINKLLAAYASLDDKMRRQLTETTKVCFFKDIPIHTVRGEFFNFKITTQYDFNVAESILSFVENSKKSEKEINKKLERYQKIAKEASEQSHRLIVPDILGVYSLSNIPLDLLCNLNLFAYEKKSGNTKDLHTLLEKSHGSISILVGPEGGFSEKEAEMVETKYGFIPISLGKRILRSETAAIYSLSVIGFYLEK